MSLQPAAAQSLALALHELVTNAAKYGALSSMSGRVHLVWELNPGTLVLGGRETAARRRKRRPRRASARGSSPPASKDSSPGRPCSTGGRKGLLCRLEGAADAEDRSAVGREQVRRGSVRTPSAGLRLERLRAKWAPVRA